MNKLKQILLTIVLLLLFANVYSIDNDYIDVFSNIPFESVSSPQVVEGYCLYGCLPGQCSCWHLVGKTWKHKNGKGVCSCHKNLKEHTVFINDSVDIVLAVIIISFCYKKYKLHDNKVKLNRRRS